MQVSLHNLDIGEIINPILAQGYTMASMAEAIAADPPSYLQLTVCEFGRMGMFAISNGFTVRWWDAPSASTEAAARSFHPFNDGLPHVRPWSPLAVPM